MPDKPWKAHDKHENLAIDLKLETKQVYSYSASLKFNCHLIKILSTDSWSNHLVT